jgi:hypothetical protein
MAVDRTQGMMVVHWRQREKFGRGEIRSRAESRELIKGCAQVGGGRIWLSTRGRGKGERCLGAGGRG